LAQRSAGHGAPAKQWLGPDPQKSQWTKP
jgi:hypothetical protein